MGKFEKKKTKSTAKKFLIAVGLTALAAVLVLFAMSRMGAQPDEKFPEPGAQTAQTQPSAEKTESAPADANQPTAAPSEQAAAPSENTQPQETQPVHTEPGLELPFRLEDGMLEIHSLFQSTGINPDYGNQEGDDIATLMVTNTAEYLLTEATINMELADGTKIRFQITNLPAGATAMAFAADHISLADDGVCVGITGKAQWDEENRAIPDGLTASVEGMMVTIVNNTAQEIPELIICCRTPLGEEYFGGKAYEYKINNLPAKGSTTFMATDCVMGLAEVVRIAIK